MLDHVDRACPLRGPPMDLRLCAFAEMVELAHTTRATCPPKHTRGRKVGGGLELQLDSGCTTSPSGGHNLSSEHSTVGGCHHCSG